MSRVHFLNVLEGDCSIIQHEDNLVSVIDVCNASNVEGTNILEKTQTFSLESNVKGNFHQKEHPENPVAYMKNLGITSIFRYIQTHPDMDHMDGLKSLKENFGICNFWDTANVKTMTEKDFETGKYKFEDWECYCSLRKSEVSPKALIYYDGDKNKYYAQDADGDKSDDYIQILSPTKELIDAANKALDWNDSSYVLLYHTHGRKILFCGDADTATLEHILTNHKENITNIDILMAPHHGRDSDKDFSFLDIMNPKLSLLGNAKSKFMAYDEWNKRNLRHITNNQAGNIIIETTSASMSIYVSNQNFADKERASFGWEPSFWNEKNQAWFLFGLKK